MTRNFFSDSVVTCRRRESRLKLTVAVGFGVNDSKIVHLFRLLVSIFPDQACNSTEVTLKLMRFDLVWLVLLSFSKLEPCCDSAEELLQHSPHSFLKKFCDLIRAGDERSVIFFGYLEA